MCIDESNEATTPVRDAHPSIRRQIEAAREEARRAGLEEAAALLDDRGTHAVRVTDWAVMRSAAKAIRALKDASGGDGG